MLFRSLKKNKVKIALASSSRMEKIEFVLNLLRLRGKFVPELCPSV